MRAAGGRVELTPELRRDLRQPDIELVRELVPDAAEPALRCAGAEDVALDEDDISLTTLAEEEGGRNTDDAATDDEGRRAVRDGQSASSVKRYVPSTLVTVPKRGRSCVKPTIHCSSTARLRIVRFASSVSSGNRSCAGIQGSGRW